MDSNYNFDDTTGPDAKIVIGVRTLPDAKMELTEEAEELGMTLSNYGETILLNRKRDKLLIEDLQSKLKISEKQLANLKSQCQLLREQPASDVAKLKMELSNTKRQVEDLAATAEILKDKRLLYLFEKVKGKDDSVENAFGDDFEITYQSPRDVLIAMIYSSRLNS